MLEFGYYNMDCMTGMKEFPDSFFDVAIVDPPYGINVGQSSMGAGGGVASHRVRSAVNLRSRGGNKQRIPFGGKRNPRFKSAEQLRLEANQSGGVSLSHPKIYKAFDDSHVPSADYFRELKRVAKNQIIWGGNYFLDYLGATSCMIVWDKARRGLNFADCEIAWTSFKQSARVFNFKWNGMLQEDMKNKEYRIHPTQKPVRLYEWLVEKFTKPNDVILDTHVGSASSLIAYKRYHRKFIGFEIDEDYYKESLERLRNETAQMTLFDFWKKEDT